MNSIKQKLFITLAAGRFIFWYFVHRTIHYHSYIPLYLGYVVSLHFYLYVIHKVLVILDNCTSASVVVLYMSR